jgi:quercetin dioxygenase-like cupin family protein
MNYTHLYTGEDGKSYFEDISVETPSDNPLGKLSQPFAVKELYFRKSIPTVYDWHPAPSKLFIVYLSGEAKVEASGGETRHFKAGDILLATDVQGDGHSSTILSEGKALVIILDQ